MSPPPQDKGKVLKPAVWSCCGAQWKQAGCTPAYHFGLTPTTQARCYQCKDIFTLAAKPRCSTSGRECVPEPVWPAEGVRKLWSEMSISEKAAKKADGVDDKGGKAASSPAGSPVRSPSTAAIFARSSRALLITPHASRSASRRFGWRPASRRCVSSQ